jgi:Fe-S-cluster containining protein
MLNKIKKIIYTKILRRKYYRQGCCLGCGKCCQKIYVKTGKHVIQDEKEFKKLQYLHRFYSYLTIIGQDETGLIFSCNNLDKTTNLCKIHKNRPGICRRYPQEELFIMGGELTEECGYKMIPIIPFKEILEKKINFQNKKLLKRLLFWMKT